MTDITSVADLTEDEAEAIGTFAALQILHYIGIMKEAPSVEAAAAALRALRGRSANCACITFNCVLELQEDALTVSCQHDAHIHVEGEQGTKGRTLQ